MFSMGDHVIAPHEDLEWMLEQPDECLDIHSHLVEVTQAVHTLMGEYAVFNPTHHKTISRDLTRRLGDLTQDIIEELALSIDDEWGTDTDNWKEVNPFATLIKIVARTGSRVFVGAPLCRNPELIENAIAFANTVVPLACLIRMLPRPIRPALVPVICYKNRVYRRNLGKILKPEIIARMQETTLRLKEGGPLAHNDFLQWTINAALKSELPREKEVQVIFERIILTNFASIHTSTISITNAIFDLISYPSTPEVIAALREEADTIVAANNGVWTKSGIAQMTKIDSALKESARLGPLSAFSFIRSVSQKGGVTTPVSGTFAPQGSALGIPVQAVHRNPNVYVDPNTYRPFRFADSRSAPPAATEPTTATAGEEKPLNLAPGLKPSAMTYPTTSPSFLTFSHGRHACPGRFFAANELRLLMAYIVQNYDFEMLDAQPDRPWFGQAIICPIDRTIRVRRRARP